MTKTTYQWLTHQDGAMKSIKAIREHTDLLMATIREAAAEIERLQNQVRDLKRKLKKKL